MVIGIDGNEANVTETVGVSVYTRAMLSYFRKKAGPNLRFRIYLRRAPLPSLPSATRYFQYTVIPASFMWSQVFLPLSLALGKKPDVFWSPAHYAPRMSTIPSVVTIHDLAYFHFPQEFLKKDLYKLFNWTEYSVRKAAKVIAVSEHTKRDVMKHYDVLSEKVEVIHNGFEKPMEAGTKLPAYYQIEPKKYILYVGTLQPRKNITTLITAFAKFKKKQPGYKLVLVGKKGWLYDEIFETVENLKLTDDVVFTGYLSDSNLVYLYKNAFCFVLPSFYEGFGIPLLEAMSYGCPVISSNASSLPEVGGDAALYFNPSNAQELASHLEFLCSDRKVGRELIKKGHERTKLFSWEKAAEQTLKVLTSATRS